MTPEVTRGTLHTDILITPASPHVTRQGIDITEAVPAGYKGRASIVENTGLFINWFIKTLVNSCIVSTKLGWTKMGLK